MKKNRGMRRKLFTILMALMVLCFTQCKPNPEGGDDNAPKVRVVCEIPMNDGSKSDFTNLMENGKVNWSHGRECVYVAIHGSKPQIIELESWAEGTPSKLEFIGEAAKGLITPGEEYDIWYFGHSHQLDAPYFNLSKDGKTLTGSIANQSGRLKDLGYCHIAKTKVKAITAENGEVKLDLKGTLANQIAIALLDLNNVTELYGDAIIGTEYSLVYNGNRFELDVEENNNAKINVASASGTSYVVLLPNDKTESNIKSKRGGKTYAYTFHNYINSNKVYYKSGLDGTTPQALPWTEVEDDADEINGHEYVDLGLPSGLLWATCNIGAATPEAYGDYYAWGVTETYVTSENNFSTYGRPLNDISGNTELDAATANWGEDWRMPTETEQNELLDKCTWTWTTIKGINGYKVIGPNGNYIFLPAAGCLFYENEGNIVHEEDGAKGCYWGSTPYSYFSWHSSGCLIEFSESEKEIISMDRIYGHSIRPVSGGNFDGPEVQYPDTNGYGYVDLGLSVNWASCNVGAKYSEEYGNYYAWGETTTKDKYDENNSVTHKLSHSELQSLGYIDENDNLTLSHDAARANWGGDWRMPTVTELNELMTECDWTLTELNGFKGYKVTGPNGNSIFLPFAGEISEGGSIQYVGFFGTYWSSTYSNDNPYYDQIDDEFYYYVSSYGFTCQDYGFIHNEIVDCSSCYGFTVRPVIRK